VSLGPGAKDENALGFVLIGFVADDAPVGLFCPQLDRSNTVPIIRSVANIYIY